MIAMRYVLEMLGVAVFATSGALAAGHKRLDRFAVVAKVQIWMLSFSVAEFKHYTANEHAQPDAYRKTCLSLDGVSD